MLVISLSPDPDLFSIQLLCYAALMDDWTDYVMMAHLLQSDVLYRRSVAKSSKVAD
jgi:hypothetical protein